MPAAHLRGPTVPREQDRFVPGCSTMSQHTQAEARAFAARRGIGRPYPCTHCGAWHVATDPAPGHRWLPGTPWHRKLTPPNHNHEGE